MTKETVATVTSIIKKKGNVTMDFLSDLEKQYGVKFEIYSLPRIGGFRKIDETKYIRLFKFQDRIFL
jgi:hypothetical protein